jgi:hypothetical protein
MLSLVTPVSGMSSQCEDVGTFLESEKPLRAHRKRVSKEVGNSQIPYENSQEPLRKFGYLSEPRTL